MWRDPSFLLSVLLKLALIGSSCCFAPPLRVPARSLGMRQEVLRCGASARQSLRLAQAPAMMAAADQPLLDEVVQQLLTLVPLCTGLGAFFMWVVQPKFEKVLKGELEELKGELQEVKGELNKKLDKNNEELKEVKEDLKEVKEELKRDLKEAGSSIRSWTS